MCPDYTFVWKSCGFWVSFCFLKISLWQSFVLASSSWEEAQVSLSHCDVHRLDCFWIIRPSMGWFLSWISTRNPNCNTDVAFAVLCKLRGRYICSHFQGVRIMKEELTGEQTFKEALKDCQISLILIVEQRSSSTWVLREKTNRSIVIMLVTVGSSFDNSHWTKVIQCPCPYNVGTVLSPFSNATEAQKLKGLPLGHLNHKVQNWALPIYFLLLYSPCFLLFTKVSSS